MRAIVYRRTGGPEVLELVERPDPEPGPGEVVVRLTRAGVNPTDHKYRSGAGGPMAFPEQVPGQDGAGTVTAVGDGVDPGRVGQRVWVWEAAYGRPGGTASEAVAVPAAQATPLPGDASDDLGAALGIPALTAHRALTVAGWAPARLAPGALEGRTVLVAGGAGAVGHAAVELAVWAGATVVATTSPAKVDLARAAGAHHVVDRTGTGVADAIREAAPAGVDVIVEVAPAHNLALDRAVLAPGGTIAAYANDADTVALPIRPSMAANTTYAFVLVYELPAQAKAHAVAAVAEAVADGAVGVGGGRGLPLHHFPLARTAEAHAAVGAGATGKVLIDIGG